MTEPLDSEPPRTILVSDICGLTEIADKFGVSSQAVWNWTRRQSDFPAPITVVSNKPVFDMTEIDAWWMKKRVTRASNGWKVGDRQDGTHTRSKRTKGSNGSRP